MGIPHNGWFILENSIKIDDLELPPFQETSMFTDMLLAGYRFVSPLKVRLWCAAGLWISMDSNAAQTSHDQAEINQKSHRNWIQPLPHVTNLTANRQLLLVSVCTLPQSVIWVSIMQVMPHLSPPGPYSQDLSDNPNNSIPVNQVACGPVEKPTF